MILLLPLVVRKMSLVRKLKLAQLKDDNLLQLMQDTSNATNFSQVKNFTLMILFGPKNNNNYVDLKVLIDCNSGIIVMWYQSIQVSIHCNIIWKCPWKEKFNLLAFGISSFHHFHKTETPLTWLICLINKNIQSGYEHPKLRSAQTHRTSYM